MLVRIPFNKQSRDRVLSDHWRNNDQFSTTDVQDFGVLLDSELSMKQRVTIASVCFNHIRCLRQIRRRIGQEVTHYPACVRLITSRLDCCNSLLAGLPVVVGCIPGSSELHISVSYLTSQEL